MLKVKINGNPPEKPKDSYRYAGKYFKLIGLIASLYERIAVLLLTSPQTLEESTPTITDFLKVRVDGWLLPDNLFPVRKPPSS